MTFRSQGLLWQVSQKLNNHWCQLLDIRDKLKENNPELAKKLTQLCNMLEELSSECED